MVVVKWATGGPRRFLPPACAPLRAGMRRPFYRKSGRRAVNIKVTPESEGARPAGVAFMVKRGGRFRARSGQVDTAGFLLF
jgi:hypothetical protein